MSQNNNPLLLALAVIGGIALILILGSWLFHGAMMGGGTMGGGMMGGMGAAAWLIGLLAAAGLVAIEFFWPAGKRKAARGHVSPLGGHLGLHERVASRGRSGC